MSLAGVLSAIREIILDTPEIPLDFENRKNFYSKRFPQLSTPEVEDLAKAEPERFSIYTNSIFQSQRGLIARRFPVTYALLGRTWKDVQGEELRGLSLIKTIHSKRPWRSNKVADLAKNFLDFVLLDCEMLNKSCAYLSEVALFEYDIFMVARLVSEATEAFVAERFTALQKLTVEELMERRLSMSSVARLGQYKFDLIPYIREFHGSGNCLPAEGPIKENSFTIVSRDHRCETHWNSLSQSVFNSLDGASRGAGCSVQELAEAFVSDRGHEPEADSFRSFMQLLFRLINNGALELQQT